MALIARFPGAYCLFGPRKFLPLIWILLTFPMPNNSTPFLPWKEGVIPERGGDTTLLRCCCRCNPREWFNLPLNVPRDSSSREVLLPGDHVPESFFAKVRTSHRYPSECVKSPKDLVKPTPSVPIYR